MKAPVSKSQGFSLVEVVVAVGIFAIAIVGVIGLLAPTAKSISETADTAVASRLADSVAVELARIRDDPAQTPTAVGDTRLDKVYDLIQTAAANPTVPFIVALADGSYAVQTSKATNSATTGQPRGIAVGDQYFAIFVSQQTGNLLYKRSGGSGFLALTVVVKWPYKLPPTGISVPSSSQSSLIYNIALTL